MIVRSAIDDDFPGLRYDYEQPIEQQTPDDGYARRDESENIRSLYDNWVDGTQANTTKMSDDWTNASFTLYTLDADDTTNNRMQLWWLRSSANEHVKGKTKSSFFTISFIFLRKSENKQKHNIIGLIIRLSRLCALVPPFNYFQFSRIVTQREGVFAGKLKKTIKNYENIMLTIKLIATSLKTMFQISNTSESELASNKTAIKYKKLFQSQNKRRHTGWFLG